MKSKHALLATTVMLGAACAHAQTQAPGLWEHTFKVTSQGGEMEKAQAQMQAQLAAMPPEQRKKIEDMMKSRGVAMGAQGTTVKFCVTKEQAAKPAEPHMTGDCKQSDIQRRGNTMSYTYACTTPRQFSGEGQITHISDKAYTGKSKLTMQVKGQPQQMGIEMTGKWLAADCGDLKPVGVLPTK